MLDDEDLELDSLSDEELLNLYKETKQSKKLSKAPDITPFESLAMGVTDTATLGSLPHIAAFLSHQISGMDQEEAKMKARELLKLAETTNPKAYGTGEFIGGFALPSLRATKSAGIIGNMGNAALEGGLYGGITNITSKNKLEEINPSQVLTQAAGSGLVSGTMSGALQGLVKGGEKVLDWTSIPDKYRAIKDKVLGKNVKRTKVLNKDLANPDDLEKLGDVASSGFYSPALQELSKIAAKEGFPLTKGSTGSQVERYAEEMALSGNKGLAKQRKMQNVRGVQRDIVSKKVQELLNKAKKLDSTPGSNYKILMDKLENKRSEMAIEYGKLYKEVDKKTGYIPKKIVTSITDKLKNAQDDLEMDLFAKKSNAFINDITNKLKSKDGESLKLKRLIALEQSVNRNLRSKEFTDNKNEYKAMLGIKDIVSNAIDKAGDALAKKQDGDFIDVYKKAKAKRREYAKFFDDEKHKKSKKTIIDILNKAAAGEEYTSATLKQKFQGSSESKFNPEAVHLTKYVDKLLGKEGTDLIKGEMIHTILDKAKDGSKPGTFNTYVEKVLKDNSEIVNKTFKKDEIEQFKNLGKLMREASPELVNPPKTAFGVSEQLKEYAKSAGDGTVKSALKLIGKAVEEKDNSLYDPILKHSDVLKNFGKYKTLTEIKRNPAIERIKEKLPKAMVEDPLKYTIQKQAVNFPLVKEREKDRWKVDYELESPDEYDQDDLELDNLSDEELERMYQEALRER